MTPCAGVQNKRKNTFLRNVNKMTGVGLDPMPLKCLVPKFSTSFNSAILPECFEVNSVDDGQRYHVQVVKIRETILFLGMSKK